MSWAHSSQSVFHGTGNAVLNIDDAQRKMALFWEGLYNLYHYSFIVHVSDFVCIVSFIVYSIDFMLCSTCMVAAIELHWMDRDTENTTQEIQAKWSIENGQRNRDALWCHERVTLKN